MCLPEVAGKLTGTGEQQIDVFKDAIIEIVLGVDAYNSSLDAQIDILGNQRDCQVRMFILQCECGSKNIVVRFVAGQGLGERAA